MGSQAIAEAIASIDEVDRRWDRKRSRKRSLRSTKSIGDRSQAIDEVDRFSDRRSRSLAIGIEEADPIDRVGRSIEE
jgi:hypothetical protein